MASVGARVVQAAARGRSATCTAAIFDLGGVVHDSPIMAIRKYCMHKGVIDVNPFLGTSPAWNGFMQGKLTSTQFFDKAFAESQAASLSGIDRTFFPGMIHTIHPVRKRRKKS